MPTPLAAQRGTLPDESLAALLQLRPDLVVPVPADMSALAIRAQSRVSAGPTLDGAARVPPPHHPRPRAGGPGHRVDPGEGPRRPAPARPDRRPRRGEQAPRALPA